MAETLASNGNVAIGANRKSDTVDCSIKGHWYPVPEVPCAGTDEKGSAAWSPL
jgi:hypothetical protein